MPECKILYKEIYDFILKKFMSQITEKQKNKIWKNVYQKTRNVEKEKTDEKNNDL